MKIFALDLSLNFELLDDVPGGTELIGFDDLMNRLFKGPPPEKDTPFVRGKTDSDFVQNIFELQANSIWRDIPASVFVIFEQEEQRKKFLDQFMELFKTREAAGGLVYNENGELLVILDKNRWTLPKGHVEWKEAIEDAAVREVKEETGIKSLELKEKITESYHTFKRRKSWVLKTTHWYRMIASSKEELVPQLEENITDIRWIKPTDWSKEGLDTYQLTRYLIKQG